MFVRCAPRTWLAGLGLTGLGLPLTSACTAESSTPSAGATAGADTGGAGGTLRSAGGDAGASAGGAGADVAGTGAGAGGAGSSGVALAGAAGTSAEAGEGGQTDVGGPGFDVERDFLTRSRAERVHSATDRPLGIRSRDLVSPICLGTITRGCGNFRRSGVRPHATLDAAGTWLGPCNRAGQKHHVDPSRLRNRTRMSV